MPWYGIRVITDLKWPTNRRLQSLVSRRSNSRYEHVPKQRFSRPRHVLFLEQRGIFVNHVHHEIVSVIEGEKHPSHCAENCCQVIRVHHVHVRVRCYLVQKE